MKAKSPVVVKVKSKMAGMILSRYVSMYFDWKQNSPLLMEERSVFGVQKVFVNYFIAFPRIGLLLKIAPIMIYV